MVAVSRQSMNIKVVTDLLLLTSQLRVESYNYLVGEISKGDVACGSHIQSFPHLQKRRAHCRLSSTDNEKSKYRKSMKVPGESPHTHTHERTRTVTHARTHTESRTHAHTHSHARTHAHTHRITHAHVRWKDQRQYLYWVEGPETIFWVEGPKTILILGSKHTPSIAFRHLPPNSARFSYATEGAVFISAQLSTDAVSALRKVWVLI